MVPMDHWGQKLLNRLLTVQLDRMDRKAHLLLNQLQKALKVHWVQKLYYQLHLDPMVLMGQRVH